MVEKYNLDNIVNDTICGLKDFQRATVDRIYHLYTKENQNRILVSDEVGLGKTLIAKGVIAKYAKYKHENGDKLFKIVYICSNSTIVEKNLNKLSINKTKSESGDTSRLSMQHLNIFKKNNENVFFNTKDNNLGIQIQLIPLTPETSFNVSNSMGTIDERALMFAILSEFGSLKGFSDQLDEIFVGNVDKDNNDNWETAKRTWDGEVAFCNFKSKEQYWKHMESELLKEEYCEHIKNLRDICQRMSENKKVDSEEIKEIVVKFRQIFADISLGILNPDLVILDEFQRFNKLLNSDKESEMGKLAHKFFHSPNVKILMLSATPYKMYSTLDELSKKESENHFSEFKELIKFLKEDRDELDKFTEIWNDYSVQLKEWCKDKNSFICAKRKAEKELYNSICRTERISESNLSDIINSDDAKNSLPILEEDITSYIDAQNILNKLDKPINVPLDYIKSAPYILSFTDGYKFKGKVKDHFKNHLEEIDDLNKDTLWLKRSQFEHYTEICPNNARLKNLMEHVFKNNASNLLWVPPSMPYYELDGAFKNCENYSKTLIFSAWEMVPKMISSLVSYEFERRTIGQLGNHEKYFDSRRRNSSKNRYLRNDFRDSKFIFTLIYPSISLINAYVPIEYFNNNLTLSKIEDNVKQSIRQDLESIEYDDTSEEYDYRWYYLAPLLLDSKDSQKYVKSWFKQVSKISDSFEKPLKENYDELHKEYKKIIKKEVKLKRKPDDLLDVLCDMAIASPSICAYRSYEKEISSNALNSHYLNTVTQVGVEFVNLMHHRESIAVINLNFNADFIYPWKNVLKYSKDGNLQAVFDEYVHLLSNEVFFTDDSRIVSINEHFLSAFKFRTTHNNKIDSFKTFKEEIETGNENKGILLRYHYATSFTEGKGDKKDFNRKKTIIDAFNSPFRPFVLSSTSIGQDGLDFHNYCRRIVHWNLPSNPIDLEQREGRINRFECLTIRQNVAKKYGNEIKNEDIDLEANIWKELFDIARENERSDNCSELVPHWGLTEYDDNLKIERIVPMYPLSIDKIRYDRLIKILSLYRLTLGQPRQEELFESILSKCSCGKKDINELFINLSPYYKDDVEDSESDCEE